MNGALQRVISTLSLVEAAQTCAIEHTRMRTRVHTHARAHARTHTQHSLNHLSTHTRVTCDIVVLQECVPVLGRGTAHQAVRKL
jgi:hypothetical protein